MKAQTIRLVGPLQRDHAKRIIDAAPDGYVVKVATETRRDRQNARMWAQLKDIQGQVPGMETYSTEDIKNRFLHALGVEMRFLPCLEGEGMFPVGMRSSKLTVKQFAGLLELITMYGERHGVRWSEPNPYQEGE